MFKDLLHALLDPTSWVVATRESRLCRQKCEQKMQLNAIEYGQDLVTQHGEEQEEQNPQSTAM